MNLLLKYKDKIVSFGLLPIIITLIGIHFFPTTAMLGTGLAISIAGLLYDVLRLKGLNFFLLQGTIGIGICFLLRLFTRYDYIPQNSLTPSLEFMLLVCAFIHVTAPEIYQYFLKKFHLNFTSSYLLEAKIIVIFSSIHLLILFFLYNELIPFSPENNFGIIYLTPTLIYVICLIINIVGIQIAATQSPREQHIIRIVPICNGKIYLTPHEGDTIIWDAPITSLFDGPLRKSLLQAKKLIKTHQTPISHTIHKKKKEPRLILSYRTQGSTPAFIQLYILPVNHEDEFKFSKGYFFTCEDIKQNPEKFSNELRIECNRLHMAAQTWKEFK